MQDIIKGLKHTFYIYSHPFDGFWTMKSEKIGNIKSSLIIFLMLILTLTYRIVSSEYLFASATLSRFSVWVLLIALSLIVVLYCVANWALTTLWEGNGSIAEIFMALMYALTPIVLVNIPLTLLTHFLVAEEAAFYSLISNISILWSVFLIIVGNSSIHEYSIFKSIITTVITLFSMVAILVLAILAGNLIQQVAVWVYTVISEVVLRS